MCNKGNTKEELSVLRQVNFIEYPYINDPSRASCYSSNVYEIQDYDCLGNVDENKDDKN